MLATQICDDGSALTQGFTVSRAGKHFIGTTHAISIRRSPRSKASMIRGSIGSNQSRSSRFRVFGNVIQTTGGPPLPKNVR